MLPELLPSSPPSPVEPLVPGPLVTEVVTAPPSSLLLPALPPVSSPAVTTSPLLLLAAPDVDVALVVAGGSSVHATVSERTVIQERAIPARIREV